MACCGLSRGVALVPGAASSPRLLVHARVRLPALRTVRPLTAVASARNRSFVVLRCGTPGYSNDDANAIVPATARPPDYEEHLLLDADENTSSDNFVPDPTASSDPKDDQIMSLSKEDKQKTSVPDDDGKEAIAVLVGAIAGTFRPLLDNFRHLRSLKSVLDTEDYHVGMPFGAAMACIGLYQLWKVDPSTCLDVALAYGFYKLSVLAADVRRRGFSNDLLARIQLAIGLTAVFKDIHKSFVPLDDIRFLVFQIYTFSVLCGLTGLKKQAEGVKSDFRDLFALFTTKDGRRELLRRLIE